MSARAGGVLFADEPMSIVHTLAARATLPPDTDDRPVPPFVAVVRRAERVAACGSLGVQPDAVVTPAPPPGVKSTLNGVHEHGATATTSNGAGVPRTLVSGADSPAYGAALGINHVFLINFLIYFQSLSKVCCAALRCRRAHRRRWPALIHDSNAPLIRAKYVTHV